MKNEAIVLPLETERDLTPATKDDVHSIVTERLMAFSKALIARGQISPPSPDCDYGPKVERM